MDPLEDRPQPSAPSVKPGRVTLRHINVVGAVIVRDGRILCAQRGSDGSLGGMWEFPGGKIEPGETPGMRSIREIDEELRCEVVVGDEVTTTTHDYDFGRVTLTTFWCELVEANQPSPSTPPCGGSLLPTSSSLNGLRPTFRRSR